MSEASAATNADNANTGVQLLQRLRDTLAEIPQFCSGMLELLPESFCMYYGKGSDAEQLNLSDAPTSKLDKLERMCDPATFGRNDEEVLDETYRKAGKMDNTNFLLGQDRLAHGKGREQSSEGGAVQAECIW